MRTIFGGPAVAGPERKIARRHRTVEKQAGRSVIGGVPGDPERRRSDDTCSLHLIMGRLVGPSTVPLHVGKEVAGQGSGFAFCGGRQCRQLTQKRKRKMKSTSKKRITSKSKSSNDEKPEFEHSSGECMRSDS